MTQMLVLGALSKGDLSGYDIQGLFRASELSKWSDILTGSIYHALKHLEREGHIAVRDLKKSGLRQKAVYCITDKGKAYLDSLIDESLSTPAVGYPSELYSAMTLIDSIPKDTAAAALERQLENLDRELESLQADFDKRKADDSTFSPILGITYEHMFTAIRQQKIFVKRVLYQLK